MMQYFDNKSKSYVYLQFCLQASFNSVGSMIIDAIWHTCADIHSITIEINFLSALDFLMHIMGNLCNTVLLLKIRSF